VIFLEENRAFCPTGEGGGIKNDCGSGEGASGQHEGWSGNDPITWPASSRETSPPPFKGAEEFGGISIQAPARIRESLKQAGLDADDAVVIAGGVPGSDVFVRPAPDFTSKGVGGDGRTPVLFSFTRDIAGVQDGIESSSVIAADSSGKAVVYHSTISVADAVKADPQKRHAAAREFYRTMVSSVEAARASGVSRISLSAAGHSSADKGNATSWKGYTIWPRMGFDAPIPASLRSSLPPSLSNARTLLQLHSTREGTKWWAENGEEVEVSLDLADRNSPQNQVFDRFVRHFGKSRREMPLVTGDEWLSPEDTLRLDQMWEEIWQSGVLAESGEQESRAFCATGDGGGVDPSCSPKNAGGGSQDKGLPGPAPDRDWWGAGEDENVRWDAETLAVRSPVEGGEKLASIQFESAGDLVTALEETGLDPTAVVSLAGGTVRGSHVLVTPYLSNIEVQTVVPIDNDDPSQGVISSSIEIVRDEDSGELSIHYGGLFPQREVRIDEVSGVAYAFGDMKPEDLTTSQRNRVASILMERFAESITVAERSGFDFAEMFAVGGDGDDNDKGYRLWPQFGFDGPLPKATIQKIPDEILLSAAGIKIPPAGSSRIPRSTVLKGLRSQVTELTVQELIASREGERWWDKNGHSIELKLNFNDKSGLGHKRFREMKAKITRLRERNKNRSVLDFFIDIIERRDDCGRTTDGRFGPQNDCASDGGGAAVADSGNNEGEGGSSTISSASSRPITSGKQWKRADDMVQYRGKDIPAKSLSRAESFSIVHGQLLSSTLKDLDVSLDQAAKVCAATNPGSSIVAIHGTLEDATAYFDDPEADHDFTTAVTFFSKVDVEGMDSAVAVGTTLALEDDNSLTLWYGMFDVTAQAREASPVGIAREMYRGVARSIVEAEKAGVEKIVMYAAGAAGDDDKFRGYRIWPRLGFDGVIPRNKITPVWSVGTGFFNKYGSNIPDRILSPRAIKEKKAGSLSIQALYETKEGQDWWESNGGPMQMEMSVGDKKSLGWRRFTSMKDKLTRRSVSNDEYFAWLDFEWRSIAAVVMAEHRAYCEAAAESRDDCGRTSDGKFGPQNDCAKEDGAAAPEGKQKSGKTKGKDSAKKSEPAREPLRWSPGSQHPDYFDAVRQSPPVTISADGKVSSSVYSQDDISPFAGKQYASPEAVGRYLTGLTSESRGRVIDSHSELSGEDFEFLASALSQQVESAKSRGHTPAFYSPEELRKQIDDYSQLHPVLKGGKTASGTCIGKLDADGNCIETDSITPEGEFLFRAVQALTSPQANPWLNMQRADDALTHFLTEPDPAKARLENAPVGGNVMQVTRGNLTRLQAVIDKVGLTGAADLFNGPPMRAGDIEKFFEDNLGLEGFTPGGYAVDEMVPMFAIFGPKVGPFFANNNGDYESLTADVWFTRTWGRLTGELISQTSPELAKSHATELLASSRMKFILEQDLDGTTVEEMKSALEVMKKTGEIPATVQGWAESRFKRYGKEGFNKGTKGVRNQEVARLSRRILKNLIKVNDQPETTVQRSNMIKVMREVASRTGLPQAFCQDLLWQDEQDIWGAAGARTFTDVGEPSLYSTGIEQMVRDPSTRLPVKKAAELAKTKKPKKAKRSLYGESEESDEVLSIGDFEQLFYEDDMQDVSPEQFADAVSDLLSSETAVQSRNFAALDFGQRMASAIVGQIASSIGFRAFCPTGDGGGVDNSCSASDSSPQLHVSSERLTTEQLAEMVSRDGTSSDDVDESMGLLKTPRRFEFVGTLIKTMPSDSSDAGDFAVRTVESAAPKGKAVPESLSDEIASAVQGIYGDAIQYSKDNKVPRGPLLDDAAMMSACLTAQIAAGVMEYPDILDSSLSVLRSNELFSTLVSEGNSPKSSANAIKVGAALYSAISDRIIVNADNSLDYINSVMASAASIYDEDAKEWHPAGGDVPYYSTTQIGHSLAHEDGHRIHYQAIRTSVGIELGVTMTSDEMSKFSSQMQLNSMKLVAHLSSRPEVTRKMFDVSGYARTNAHEFVAEYYTALALGVAERDSDLDEAMGIMGFPKDKIPAGRKASKASKKGSKKK
jgi:hypothetical protein